MHSIFSFLIFNIDVRSKNRRINIANICRKDFVEMKRIVQSLDPGRLEKAKIKLKAFGKINDKAINQLLKNLLSYGYRQSMSRESRLTIHRKIKSFIVRYSIPAI